MKIIIVDWVPLKNKGEQAIVFGIREILSSLYGDVEIAVLDEVEEPQKTDDGIIVFPVKNIYPQYFSNIFKNRAKQSKKYNIDRIIHSLLASLSIYRNYHKNVDHLYLEYIKTADLILVGHDGAFGYLNASYVKYIHEKYKVEYALFGSGFTLGGKAKKFLIPLYRKVFNSAQFIVTREDTAYGIVKELRRDSDNIYLAADPAFVMKPLYTSNIEKYLKLIKEKQNKGKIVVGVTLTENSTIFSSSLPGKNISTIEKKNRHRDFIANTLNLVAESKKITYVFLPHSIQPGLGNDVIINQDVVKQLLGSENISIEDDLNADNLKYIISKLDFLIAERTHSAIGSISVSTPFSMLTTKQDVRSHDIIGRMFKLENALIDISQYDSMEVSSKIIENINTDYNFDEYEKQIVKLIDISKKVFKHADKKHSRGSKK